MSRTTINWESVGLGTKSDRALAEELGVPTHRVTWHRKRLKIPAYAVQSGLGRAWHRRKAVNWDTVQLGSCPDPEIARQLGISPDVVRRRRVGLKIPSFRGRRTAMYNAAPLGQVSDAVLAKQMGVSVDLVLAARVYRGIKPVPTEKFLTTEGEPATYGEAVIDLWLHEQGLPHSFQHRIGRFRADWLVSGCLAVEYAGWSEHPKFGPRYKERLAKKAAFYASRGFLLLLVYPEDLKHFKSDGEIRTVDGFSCRACGTTKRSPRDARGFCGKCYKRHRRQERKAAAIAG